MLVKDFLMTFDDAFDVAVAVIDEDKGTKRDFPCIINLRKRYGNSDIVFWNIIDKKLIMKVKHGSESDTTVKGLLSAFSTPSELKIRVLDKKSCSFTDFLFDLNGVT